MTLKDKFKPFVFYVAASFNVAREKDKEKNANECEKIADEFAIGFAEWYEEEILAKGDFNMIEKPKKELLEIYKKEKGL